MNVAQSFGHLFIYLFSFFWSSFQPKLFQFSEAHRLKPAASKSQISFHGFLALVLTEEKLNKTQKKPQNQKPLKQNQPTEFLTGSQYWNILE